MEVIEANTKLLKKAEEFTSAAAGNGDMRSQSQRKVMECVPCAQDVKRRPGSKRAGAAAVPPRAAAARRHGCSWRGGEPATTV